MLILIPHTHAFIPELYHIFHERFQEHIIINATFFGPWISDSRMSPDLPTGTGKSIGGDLDVDDEGSEQRWFKPMQSLLHGFVGYQPVHTRIGLTKKAMSLQANREHKQEKERTILNRR
jgi:hypothetical protein